MKYSAVVFDVDGTLLNTAEGVLSAVRYAIGSCSLPPLSDKEMETFIGPPIQNSLMKYYGLNVDEAQRVANIFRERYKGEDLLKATPYEGIYPLLEQLKKKGIKIAIATYKRQDYARKLLKHFGFDRFTDILYGADNQNKLKKKDIIEKCMIDMGITDYSKAVMVGDSDNDAVGAHSLKMDFIGVTYGFGFKTAADVMEFNAAGCAEYPEQIAKIIFGEEKSED